MKIQGTRFKVQETEIKVEKLYKQYDFSRVLKTKESENP